MNVLVVGCGRLGTRLANKLDREGHDVSVVDISADMFRQLSDDFDGITITGMPMDMNVLQNAGVESCDAVAVVTPDDNLNITVSQIVREFFGVQNVVARISDPARENVFKRFGLRSVCPTKLAGDAIFHALSHPWDDQQVTFETSTVSFVTRPVDKRYANCSVKSMVIPEGETLFGVIHADGNMELITENNNIILSQADRLVFASISD